MPKPNFARDRQTEAAAAFVLIARLVKNTSSGIDGGMPGPSSFTVGVSQR